MAMVQFLMTGRDGKITVSRRDGTVVSNGRDLIGGTGRHFTTEEVISTGRNGK